MRFNTPIEIRVVNDAIEAHADLNVEMPEGPSKFLYADKEECRKILERNGFDGESVVFETDLVEWNVPTPHYLFEAERDAVAQIDAAGLEIVSRRRLPGEIALAEIVAQGLVRRPRLLMLDEPSAGLSPVLVDRVLVVVRRLRESGTAVLLVEQLIEKAMDLPFRWRHTLSSHRNACSTGF